MVDPITFKSKWLSFIEYNPFRIDGKLNRKKTTSYWIRNKDNGCMLGEIKWYGPFRKYSFFPESEIVFEKTCLEDIARFLSDVEIDRKSKLKT